MGSSCEASSGAPYRVINWSEGPDTEAVTAGRSGIQTWQYLVGAECDAPSPYLVGVPSLIDELEDITAKQPFEFEFGVSADGTLVLFQARPLVNGDERIPRSRHRAVVLRCQNRLRSLMREQPPAIGPETVLGVMPDWNPAEMIGVRPRPLALSLYRELITDQTWSESRVRYGYRDVRGVPLLVDLYGLPYIDVRASFTSLVPRAVDEDTAQRLVRYYVAKLKANPHLHDKVEFDIVLCSYHFGTDPMASELVAEGVLSGGQAASLVAALRALTVDMLDAAGQYRRDLHAIRLLARGALPRLGTVTSPARRINTLLDFGVKRGALPFAGVARAAFAATSMVKSLVQLGVLSADEAAVLISSGNTVNLQRDFAAMDRTSFLRRYGHLRPGTYDIRSPRYDETFPKYFDRSGTAASHPEKLRFRASSGQLRAIRRLLAEREITCGAGDLLRFIRGSVAARERGKLEYSRVVSELLAEMRRIGEQLGLDAEGMSYATVEAFRGLTGDRRRDRRSLAKAVERGREHHSVTESLCGPALLCDPAELTSFVMREMEPNFITQSRVVARVADVDRGDQLKGAIAMVVAADPGYDWIFTHDIAGLVTAYGGANSHMAIRTLELGIPAVVGVGEARFRRWLSAGMLEIDAASRLARPVST